MTDTRETNTSAAAKSVIPNISDNPISSIGLVLSNVAAGMRGQPLPSQQLLQNEQERKRLELQRMGVMFDAVQQGVEMFGGADLSDVNTKASYDKFVGGFSEVLPGFNEALKAGIDIRNKHGMQAIQGAGEHVNKVYAICGLDGDCAKKVITNPQLMAQFDKSDDAERLPTILQKFQVIAEAVGGNDELKKLIADGKWTLGDLRQLPEGFDFTEGELKTISRNKEIQSALMEYGFEPPSTTEFRKKEEIKASVGADQPSVQKVIAPILEKLSKGGELTEGEKGALDIYRRMSPLDRMIEDRMGIAVTPEKKAPSDTFEKWKARANKGETFTEEELRDLRKNDRETFDKLLKYLESK